VKLDAPWTREPGDKDWKAVAELYCREAIKRDLREREALAWGINCRLRRDAK
jgi:hypothetical protein